MTYRIVLRAMLRHRVEAAANRQGWRPLGLQGLGDVFGRKPLFPDRRNASTSRPRTRWAANVRAGSANSFHCDHPGSCASSAGPRGDTLLSASNTVYLVDPYRKQFATLRKGQPTRQHPINDERPPGEQQLDVKFFVLPTKPIRADATHPVINWTPPHRRCPARNARCLDRKSVV